MVADGFDRLHPHELDPVSVMPQALDDQWIPPDLLNRMTASGRPRSHFTAELIESARTEYLRALVNASSVIVNRAFIVNNSVVFRDFSRQRGATEQVRAAFRDLVASRAIVPYLYSERTPRECHVPNYPEEVFADWIEVCDQVRVACARLAWPEVQGNGTVNDSENGDLAREKVASRFHRYVLTAETGVPRRFRRDLKLVSEDEGLELARQFRRIATYIRETVDVGSLINRTRLYDEFVIDSERLTTTDPIYANRADKPFAPEIKQLLDLRYNCNLPDVLGGYVLTPPDALPRTALQEDIAASKEVEIDADQIWRFWQAVRFNTIQTTLAVRQLGELSLPVIAKLREQPSWRLYIDAVRTLLKDPFADPETRFVEIQSRYDRMLETLTRLGQEVNGAPDGAGWQQVGEMVIDFGGAQIAVVDDPVVGPYYYFPAGQETEPPPGGHLVPVIGRFNMRDRQTGVAWRDDHSLSLPFFTKAMTGAREQWRALRRLLPELLIGGRKLINAGEQPLRPAATSNYQVPE